MTLSDLKNRLSSCGLPTNGSKPELAGRFMEAFRARRSSIEGMLNISPAEYVCDLCDELGLPTGRKQDNMDALLKRLATLEQDGALYRRDEVA